MKNFVQPGVNITVTAPGAVSSGDFVVVGSLFGVATGDAESGDPVVLATEGVFELSKVSTDAFTAGAPVYWDSDPGIMTTTSIDNLKVGVAVVAAGNPSGTVKVRLNGSF